MPESTKGKNIYAEEYAAVDVSFPSENSHQQVPEDEVPKQAALK